MSARTCLCAPASLLRRRSVVLQQLQQRSGRIVRGPDVTQVDRNGANNTTATHSAIDDAELETESPYSCNSRHESQSNWTNVLSRSQDCGLIGQPFVKRFALVCLSVLSVTLVYCGQWVGWIKTKLGTRVGRGPGHIVLDGDPPPPAPKGHSPHRISAHICCG